MKTNQSELKAVKSGTYTYLYLYFKSGGNILRINTYNKTIKNGMNKDLTFNASVQNYKKLNSDTQDLKQKVDGYIAYKLELYKGTVSQKECIEYITSSNYVRHFNNNTLVRVNDFIPEPAKAIKSVMDYYEEFLTFKTKELQGLKNSLSNYLALKLSLCEFEILTNTLTFERINTKDFNINFKAYLSTTKLNKNTGGYLCTNSVNLRLTCLKTFYLWLTDNDIHTIKSNVLRNESAVKNNHVIALSKEDLKLLQALKDLTPKEQHIIDLFVCNSLMGMRYSDCMLLNSNNFSKHPTGETFIKQTNLKTGIEVTIQVQPTSLIILEKYGFKFNKISLPYFNNQLAEILKARNLFSELVTVQLKENNTITDVKVMRRTLISSHSMRKNFINLSLKQNVPINVLMTATGHRNLSTIQSYVERTSDVKAFAGIDL